MSEIPESCEFIAKREDFRQSLSSAMTFLEWRQPDCWQEVAPGTVGNSVAVIGLIYSLRGASPEDLFESINRLSIAETDLSIRALGAYPLAAADVESFLRCAGAVLDPAIAAAKISERLIALEASINETTLARNVLDVWQHCHSLVVSEAHHGNHCSCLLNCDQMPRGIRSLDEAVQSYYEQHHHVPVPECFGSSDDSYRQSLGPLLRRCLDGAS